MSETLFLSQQMQAFLSPVGRNRLPILFVRMRDHVMLQVLGITTFRRMTLPRGSHQFIHIYFSNDLAMRDYLRTGVPKKVRKERKGRSPRGFTHRHD